MASTTTAINVATTTSAMMIEGASFFVFTYRPNAPIFEYPIRLILCVFVISIFVCCPKFIEIDPRVFFMFLVVGLERQVQRKPLGFGPFTYVFRFILGRKMFSVSLHNNKHSAVGLGVSPRHFNFTARTVCRHSLVSTGSCSASILAIIIAPAGPLVLMSSTVSGISFLGAGALIKSSDGSTQGFTTGSLLVLTAFIGICMGAGMYLLSFMLYVGMWVVLSIDRILQYKGVGVHGFRIVLTYSIQSDDEPVNELSPSKDVSIKALSERMSSDDDEDNDNDDEANTAHSSGSETLSSSNNHMIAVDVPMLTPVDDQPSLLSHATNVRRRGGLPHGMPDDENKGGRRRVTSAGSFGLSVALSGAERVLAAFRASNVKVYMQALDIDRSKAGETIAKLTLTVRAKREQVHNFLGNINVHLARGNYGTADKIIVKGVLVTLN